MSRHVMSGRSRSTSQYRIVSNRVVLRRSALHRIVSWCRVVPCCIVSYRVMSSAIWKDVSDQGGFEPSKAKKATKIVGKPSLLGSESPYIRFRPFPKFTGNFGSPAPKFPGNFGPGYTAEGT